MTSCSICNSQIAPGQDICTSCWESRSRKKVFNDSNKESSMYYFVLTNPESTGVNLSMYFTSYREALEYAKSVERNNPKIIKYDSSQNYSLMYNNILHIIK